MLNHSLSWSKFVNTHLYHSRQWFNIRLTVCLVGRWNRTAGWLQVFVIDNCIEDWRIAMSLRKTVQILVELVVCSIHPVPGSFYFVWTVVHANGETATTSRVPIDLILSLPMFLRLYLVCRGTHARSPFRL